MTAEDRRTGTPVYALLADVEASIEDWFRTRVPLRFRGGAFWAPQTDVYETESAFVVTMAIPGMRVENISVEFEHETLRVAGTRHEPCADRRHYHTMEIPVGPFERRVRILPRIRVDAIEVTYRAGLLQITLPKDPSARDVPID